MDMTVQQRYSPSNSCGASFTQGKGGGRGCETGAPGSLGYESNTPSCVGRAPLDITRTQQLQPWSVQKDGPACISLRNRTSSGIIDIVGHRCSEDVLPMRTDRVLMIGLSYHTANRG